MKEALGKLNILRIMGCESNQYGSMERYLIKLTERATARGHKHFVVYDKLPTVLGFKKDIENAGGVFLTLKMKNPFDLSIFSRLHNLIRSNSINTVHAYFTPMCHYVMLYAWFTNIRKRFRTSANMPFTTHTSSRRITPWFKWRFALKQKILARFPRKVILLSDAMYHEFISLGVNPDKLTVIHGGVDLEYFFPDNTNGRKLIRNELCISIDTSVIGTLVRLVPIKGLKTLLEAVPKILKSEQDVRIIIVGDGPQEAELIKIARELRIEDYVLFLGHRNDARDILAALDVFVLPSFSEGMSNSLMEAMSCALPIVASSIEPNKVLIKDNTNGILFQAGDSEQLANVIVKIQKDKLFSAELGAMARATIEKEYSITKRIDNELDLYEEIV